MDVFLVELVLHLLPCMVEDIFTFFGRLVIENCIEGYRFALAVLNSYLLDTPTSTEVEVFALLVWNHHTTADVFHNKFGAVFFQVLTPKVRTFFERSLVIKFVTLFTQNGIAE